MTEAGRRTTLV